MGVDKVAIPPPLAEELRRQGKLRQLKSLAESTGISYSRLANIAFDRVKTISAAEIELLEKHIGSGFSVAESRTEYIAGGLHRIATLPVKAIPVIGRASAGPGADDHFESEIYIPAHMATAHGVCGYIAEGDSMMPWIHPGDIVVVRPHHSERLGYAFLIEREPGTYSVKMLGYDGKEWEFRSLNPKYEPERSPARLIGYVIGIYRLIGSTETMMLDQNGLRPQI